MFINITMLEIQKFELLDQSWKRWAPTNDTNPRKTFFKSWIWDQYLPEKHEMEVWQICETIKQ